MRVHLLEYVSRLCQHGLHASVNIPQLSLDRTREMCVCPDVVNRLSQVDPLLH